MATETEFLIVCNELSHADAIAHIEGETGFKFSLFKNGESQVCCLEVYGLNVRRCLISERESVIAAFKQAVFLEPEIATLFILADDGSVLERVPRT